MFGQSLSQRMLHLPNYYIGNIFRFAESLKNLYDIDGGEVFVVNISVQMGWFS